MVSSRPMLRYQVVGADVLGTTTGTRETIGTITLPTNCTKVHGFIIQRGSSGTTTTAEATQGKVYANCRSLAFQELILGCGQPTGAGAATNEAGVYDPGIYYPFTQKAGSNPSNEQITFYYDTQIEMTQEDYVQVFVLSSDGPINESVLQQRGDPLSAIKGNVGWSAIASDIDIYDVVSEKMANNITVPFGPGGDRVKALHAAVVTVASDAVQTGAEHFFGYATLSGSVPGIENINIPLPAISGSLGTSIDWSPNLRSWVYPLYIPSGPNNANETIDVTVNLAAVTTAANLVSIGFLGSI